jgi:hypothetical protein
VLVFASVMVVWLALVPLAVVYAGTRCTRRRRSAQRRWTAAEAVAHARDAAPAAVPRPASERRPACLAGPSRHVPSPERYSPRRLSTYGTVLSSTFRSSQSDQFAP